MTYDIIFLLVIFLCIVMGLIKGFINSLFGMGAPVLSIWISAFFYKKLAFYLANYIQSDAAVLVLSFVIIFVFVFLALKLFQQLVNKIFGGEIFRSLDRILGLLFGFAEGLALVIFMIFVISIIPEQKFNEGVKKSHTYEITGKFVSFPKIHIPKVTK
ncbi:CvpA family protein [Treponema sp.]|uniref:CvpA family protein n=1 Tax=Treponema sp. TaxID=166 RepID=UPI0025FBA59D|nr:CvpA family protein [Treponema sp.]MCR5218011.1 CvpA family protein [Treponema sp.]